MPRARPSPARCSRSTSTAPRASCSTSPARRTSSLFEVTEAAEEIRAVADPEANIIFGTSFDERLADEVMITVIATGFDPSRKRDAAAPRDAASRRRWRSTPRATTEPTSSRSWSTRGRTRRFRSIADPGADYGPIGTPERQPVPVPVQPAPTHRPIAGPAADASDLRRHGPGDPELPAAARAGGQGLALRRRWASLRIRMQSPGFARRVRSSWMSVAERMRSGGARPGGRPARGRIQDRERRPARGRRWPPA